MLLKGTCEVTHTTTREAITKGWRLKSGELHGITRFEIHEGKLEEFERLSAQCMEIVRTKDTGTLQYDIYFNDDWSKCIVHERYRKSEALIDHAAHLGDLMEAILATGSASGEFLVSRTQTSEPRWRALWSVFSHPSRRCRHRSPAPERLIRVWHPS